jgi:hypothetical protein
MSKGRIGRQEGGTGRSTDGWADRRGRGDEERADEPSEGDR